MRACIALLALFLLAPVPGAAQAPARPLRVLFVGNSLTYTNDLPAMLSALARSQPVPVAIETSAWVQAGGSIAERWRDDHAAEALREGRWDVLVLQERGGQPACMAERSIRRSPDCRDSLASHRAFAALARARGAQPWLLGTWFEDRASQPRLDAGTRRLATAIGAGVVPAGDALHDYARKHGRDAAFADAIHPSLPSTLVMAMQLFEAITGHAPAASDITVAFPLLPPAFIPDPAAPLERQASFAHAPQVLVMTAEATQAMRETASRHPPRRPAGERRARPR